jgi:hypothetical protein
MYLIQIIIFNSNNVTNESTPFITPIKCKVFINKSFKAASTCFGTSVPSQGEQNAIFKKSIVTAKLLLIRFNGL